MHVWIDDLAAMYHSIFRVLKPGGINIAYEIHPFQRPFGENLTVKKPYDHTGPFEDEACITYGWRMQDIVNAMLDSGIRLRRMEEMFAEKSYDEPFFVRHENIVNGSVTVTHEEVDRMHDWRHNPMAALPNWMCLVGQK